MNTCPPLLNLSDDLLKENTESRKTSNHVIENVSAPARLPQTTPLHSEQFPNDVSISSLVSRRDKIYAVLSCLGAVIHGSVVPLSTIVLGSAVGVLQEGGNKLVDDTAILAQALVALGLLAGVSSFVQSGFGKAASAAYVLKLRSLHFDALMRQELAWHAEAANTDIANGIGKDIADIKQASVSKIALSIQYLISVLCGLFISIYASWKLSLVLYIGLLLAAGSHALLFKLVKSAQDKQLRPASRRASTVSKESLLYIKTVHAFRGHAEEVGRYEYELKKMHRAALSSGLRRSVAVFTSTVLASTGLVTFFWYSRILGERNSISPTRVSKSLLSCLCCTYKFRKLLANFPAFAKAQMALERIRCIVRRAPPIDPTDRKGVIPRRIKGDICFENILMHSRNLQEKQRRSCVLENFSMKIQAGTTHALLGDPGKWVVADLLLRFWDPTDGYVTIDGADIRQLNVSWTRDQVGYIDQNATLFPGFTIRENILFGASQGVAPRDIRRKYISDTVARDAAKASGAHELILSAAPDGYETIVGGPGVSLPAELAIRLCIARVFVRDPRFLVVVDPIAHMNAGARVPLQKTIEEVSKGRTTLLISSRYSSVKHAQVISILGPDGFVIESGSHEALMKNPQGTYKRAFEADKKLHNPTDEESSKKEPSEEAEPVLNLTPKKGSTFFRLLGQSNKAFLFLVVGCISAAIAGSCPAAAGYVVGMFIVNIAKSGERRMFALSFGILCWTGAAFVIGQGARILCLTESGEGVAEKLKLRSLQSVLSFDLRTFDLHGYRPDGFTRFLSTEVSNGQRPMGFLLGRVSFFLAMVVSGIVLSFAAGWRFGLMALVVLAPLTALARREHTWAEERVDFSLSEDDIGTDMVSHVLACYRTVTSLGLGKKFARRYNVVLEQAQTSERSQARIVGLRMGISQLFPLAVLAIALAYGGVLQSKRLIANATGTLQAMIGMYLAGIALGELVLLVPQFRCSLNSAAKIFLLWEKQKSRLEDRLVEGDDEIAKSPVILKQADIGGFVEFRNTVFQYPRRNRKGNQHKLIGLSMLLGSGKRLGIVGSYGSGKMIIDLLERFYDPLVGSVLLDGYDLKKLDTGSARACLAYVPEKPAIFSRSIKDNIGYGLLGFEDGTPLASGQVMAAAMAANVHEYISGLADGYETDLGTVALPADVLKRISIARAMMRLPKILLVEDPTHGLPSGEREVLDALEVAGKNRTTIIVSRRINSLILSANKIAVISNGNIIEFGSHSTLMKNRGAYASMVHEQVR